MLNLSQNNTFVKLLTSASDSKCVGNIPGTQFAKTSSALPLRF